LLNIGWHSELNGHHYSQSLTSPQAGYPKVDDPLCDTWDSDDGCPVLKLVQFVEDEDNPKDWQFKKRVMKPGRYLPGQEPEEHENYEKSRAGNQAEGAEGSSSKSTKGKKAVTFKVPEEGHRNEVNASAKATAQAKGKGKTTVEQPEVPSKATSQAKGKGKATVEQEVPSKPTTRAKGKGKATVEQEVPSKSTTRAKGKGKTTVEQEVANKSSSVNAKKKAEPVKSVTNKKGMSQVL
jgi:hypothetical protein